MKTEKRKANVGERILIKNAECGQCEYKNGDIATVVDKKAFVSSLRYVNEWERSVHECEYEVIVETPQKPKKSERITALETQVAELQAKVEALESAGKYPLTAKFERESAEVDGILADIKRKAKTPNQQRADVIKRAKAFVADRRPYYKSNGLISLDFVVNSEKRTVVAITRGIHSKGVYSKGIAKCDPDDVFNADIGKAIALARALGVEVPECYVKAVQPTEHVIGQRIYLTKACPDMLINSDRTSQAEKLVRLSFVIEDYDNTRILDDTNAVYE